MAKKKEDKQEDATINIESDFSNRIIKEVEKDLGKGIMIDASQIIDEKLETFSVSPNIDMILSGGIKEGTMNSVCGLPGYGKSTILLTIAAAAQKKGRMVYYDNVENRLEPKILKGIKGLDLSPDKFRVFGSSRAEKRVLTGKEHLQICEKIIKTHPGCVLMIDSLSSLSGDKEGQEGLGTGMSGASNASMVTQFVRLNKDALFVNKVTLCSICKMMTNPGGYGPSIKEKGALEWSFQCASKLRAVSKKNWEVGDKVIGIITKWVCDKSDFGPPSMECESFLRFGVGLDRDYEILEMGKSVGLINKAGSWFAAEFLADFGVDKKDFTFQGEYKLYQAFQENKDWMDKLNIKVNEFIGVKS